ncbi:hypothetical protein OAI07_01270 [Akkermansiaceae bacterium]|nr:hypothetical protein [Akkermansiaceae bacterium]
MNKYKLHWLGGRVEIIKGHSIEEAFLKAGYSSKRVKALEYYSSV